LSVLDSTCPAIHTALQASEKGVSFMPLGGLIGSDLVKYRDDWKVIDDPLGLGFGPIVLLPAIKPDIAIFHSSRADKNGNVWIGRRRELMTMAHASKTALVTVEKIEDKNFLDDEQLAAGTLPAMYIKAIAIAEKGAWPQALTGWYERDLDHIRSYAIQAKTMEGFQSYLTEHILGPASYG
jgi:glutaconate CoA-transferase subunit A